MSFRGIRTEDLSKKFSRDWVLRDINSTFSEGECWAILGPNGTGKSTFLKVLTGYIAPTKGQIVWQFGKDVPLENRFRYFSMSAPYLEVPEEFNLRELLSFHFSLKNKRSGVELSQIVEQAGLTSHVGKPVRDFSSGMKQRVKLILCLLSDVPVYILDEPCTNLDDEGVEFYEFLLSGLPSDRICLIGSNDPREFRLAKQHLSLKRSA